MNKRFISHVVLVFFVYYLPSIQGQKSFLDTPEILSLFRIARRLIFDIAGRTGTEPRLLQNAFQERKVQFPLAEDVRFPCNVTDGRSPQVPRSVHLLRPGDIDIVAAMGDSLTACLGCFATNIFQVLVDNRGVSSLGGGQGTWRQYITVPNILKVFNPNLFGYALSDSLTIDAASQFNVAEAGAISNNMPYMAEVLVKRIKADPRVDAENHWKLISIMIGSNDFCSEMCYRESPWLVVKDHKRNLLKALRYLRDNLPRTLVSIINSPNLRTLHDINNRTPIGEVAVDIECPCLFGLNYRKFLPEYYRIMEKWQLMEEEIARYPEFSRNDFAVITQIFSRSVLIPKHPNGASDLSYLSPDTFHASQKAHARFAVAVWNNMMQPASKKTKGWFHVYENFECPTSERPYLSTWYNEDALKTG